MEWITAEVCVWLGDLLFSLQEYLQWKALWKFCWQPWLMRLALRHLYCIYSKIYTIKNTKIPKDNIIFFFYCI